eukprot:COSAG05_NODE_1198_length_5555_cov_3.672287_1_plen_37_part_00
MRAVSGEHVVRIYLGNLFLATKPGGFFHDVSFVTLS